MQDATIVLAGREYAIPQLAIRQNRHVEVLAARHRDYYVRAYKANGELMLLDLTEGEATDFSEIVYWALTRALPTLTKEQFEAMPITMTEVMTALPACLVQSGLFKVAAEPAPQTGEVRSQSPSTGTT